MYTVTADRSVQKNQFDAIARSFLQQGGLPFSGVLSAEKIEQAFRERGALFAQDDVYSTQVVLWAFLAQVLRGGKGAACAAAVQDIANYLQQIGASVPAGDTGDYCRARAKLSPEALHDLVSQTAGQLQEHAQQSWLWHGRRAKLVDGFTFTMPDTPDNQRRYPQQKNQRAGAGFPIARACAVLSLATAAIHDIKIGPYQGKQTGENALLRDILDIFGKGDIAVFDRYFCSFMMLALLCMRGADFCARLHQLRNSDFRRGKRLGKDDHLITWTRPPRPDWMSAELYGQIPQTMTLREIRFRVVVPGRRTEVITVVTSLIDPKQYSAQDIAELYGFRWCAELDIRDIKQTLGLDHARCKSPAMVELELWVTLLAYNLIRGLIATAATVHGKQPRQLGFTMACQAVLSSWILLATDACRDPAELWRLTLQRIADNEVANRPGRIEPRVLKRRQKRYPFMHGPRKDLRRKLLEQ